MNHLELRRGAALRTRYAALTINNEIAFFNNEFAARPRLGKCLFTLV